MADSVSVAVRIPASLRELTGGRERLVLDARTVDGLLEQIRREQPLLAGRLFSDDGELRGFVNVFVDGIEIRRLDSGDRELREGTSVTIVPSVAGG